IIVYLYLALQDRLVKEMCCHFNQRFANPAMYAKNMLRSVLEKLAQHKRCSGYLNKPYLESKRCTA
ncbi:hypothetical protein CRN51_01565, partial [Vibrio vulnificus]